MVLIFCLFVLERHTITRNKWSFLWQPDVQQMFVEWRNKLQSPGIESLDTHVYKGLPSMRLSSQCFHMFKPPKAGIHDDSTLNLGEQHPRKSHSLCCPRRDHQRPISQSPVTWGGGECHFWSAGPAGEVWWAPLRDPERIQSAANKGLWPPSSRSWQTAAQCSSCSKRQKEASNCWLPSVLRGPQKSSNYLWMHNDWLISWCGLKREILGAW